MSAGNTHLPLSRHLSQAWQRVTLIGLASALLAIVTTLVIDQRNEISKARIELASQFNLAYEQAFIEIAMERQSDLDAKLDSIKSEYKAKFLEIISDEDIASVDQKWPSSLWIKKVLVNRSGQNLVMGIPAPPIRLPLTHCFLALAPVLVFALLGFLTLYKRLSNTIIVPLNHVARDLDDDASSVLGPAALEIISLRSQIQEIRQQSRSEYKAKLEESAQLERDLLQKYAAVLFDQIKDFLVRMKEWVKVVDIPKGLLSELNLLIANPAQVTETTLNTFLSERQKPPFSNSPLSCLPIFDDVNKIAQTYKTKALSLGIHLYFECMSTIQAKYCSLSANELKSVLSIILDNAIDAALNSRKKEILLSVKTDGDDCIVKIKDFGPGFSKASWESYVMSETFTTKVNGSGTGIKTAKTLLKPHKGQLTYLRVFDATLATLQFPMVPAPERADIQEDSLNTRTANV